MVLLQDKVVLVIGLGCGLGCVCVQIFVCEGVWVVVVDCDCEGGEEIVEFVCQVGFEVLFVQMDVFDVVDVWCMVQVVVDCFGGFDCVVNNVVCSIGWYLFVELDEVDWECVLVVNVSGVFFCMKYEIEVMFV